MARSQNPIDVHRRQQRKKELQKNKTTRIQARDERVKQTKSVAEVKDAIQKLEKRKASLSHPEKQKLDRLYKELKLTKQAQEEKKSTQPLQQQKQQPLTELDDPRKSVYWDEMLNPYGAPPPGKPRLYHRRGGGVTMDMTEAIVPGEEGEIVRAGVPPPQPPPRRDESQSYQQNRVSSHHEQQQQQKHNRVPPPPPRQAPPPPPPPPPLPAKEEATKTSTTSVPSLPPPSKAVKRLAKKRRKLDADIWASTEEVEYHKKHDQMDLEGTTNAEVLWWYRDSSNQVQGPFSSLQMQSWYQAGL